MQIYLSNHQAQLWSGVEPGSSITRPNIIFNTNIRRVGYAWLCMQIVVLLHA